MANGLATITKTAELLAVTRDLIDEWLSQVVADEGSPNTVAAYRIGVHLFRTWLQERGQAADVVTPADVVQFKLELAERYSSQTVNLRLTAVRQFYRWAVATDRIAVNPAAEVRGAKRPKSKTHRRDALTNAEVLAVLATCDNDLAGIRDRAILSLFAFCGLRQVEVNRANIGHLRTRGDRLTLDVRGKGRTEADEYVIIPRGQEPVIRAWVVHRLTFAECGAGDPLFVSLSNATRGKKLSLRGIRSLVKRRYRAAGVVGVGKSTHSLRHSAITNVIRRGGTPMQAQAMARHASLDTTLGYFHAVSRLDSPAEDLIDYSWTNGNSREVPIDR